MFNLDVRNQQKKPPYPTNSISGEAITFLDRCLEFDPNDRYTADRLLDHPFVKVSSEEYSSI